VIFYDLAFIIQFMCYLICFSSIMARVYSATKLIIFHFNSWLTFHQLSHLLREYFLPVSCTTNTFLDDSRRWGRHELGLDLENNSPQQMNILRQHADKICTWVKENITFPYHQQNPRLCREKNMLSGNPKNVIMVV